MKIIQNQKSGHTLSFEGHMYTIDKQREVKIIWRCIRKNFCKARLHTSVDNISILLKRNNEHTHSSSTASVAVLRASKDLHLQAVNSHETPKCSVSGDNADLTQVTAAAMPSLDSLRQKINHICHIQRSIRPNPTSLEDLAIS